MKKMEKILRKIELALPHIWSFIMLSGVTVALTTGLIFLIKLLIRVIGVGI